MIQVLWQPKQYCYKVAEQKRLIFESKQLTELRIVRNKIHLDLIFNEIETICVKLKNTKNKLLLIKLNKRFDFLADLYSLSNPFTEDINYTLK